MPLIIRGARRVEAQRLKSAVREEMGSIVEGLFWKLS
jgi:hypothetical protein